VLSDILGKLTIYGVLEAVTLYSSEDFVDIFAAQSDALS
jgi:hypothetical protein